MIYFPFQHSIVVLLLMMFFYESVPTTVNQMYRIVVPMSRRHIIFFLLHASPDTGHIGEYKTLYRIRLRFLGSKMRCNIHRWIEQYPHCQLAFR